MVKTGECYFRDADGALWLAETLCNTKTGEVTTKDTLIEPAPPVAE